jgi:hypothetical protein
MTTREIGACGTRWLGSGMETPTQTLYGRGFNSSLNYFSLGILVYRQNGWGLIRIERLDLIVMNLDVLLICEIQINLLLV